MLSLRERRLALRNPTDRHSILHSVRAGDVRFWPWAKKRNPLTSPGSLAPPPSAMPFCFALCRPLSPRIPPQSSLAEWTSRWGDGVQPLFPLSPPRRETRRIQKWGWCRVQQRVYPGIALKRGERGLPSTLRLPLRRLPAREPSRTPFVPTFSVFLFFFLLLFPHTREREEYERKREDLKEKGARGEGEPRRLMEYIMMRPAVLRRLNGRVCVLCKRWSRRRREIFVADGERGSITLKYWKKKEKGCTQIDHKFVRYDRRI